MDIIGYFSSHHAQLLILIGAIALVVELTVMGLSGPLLFFALSCFLTAVLAGLGILHSWESEVLSVGTITAVIAVILWQPLKRFQNNGGGPDTSSDMIGKHVPCSVEITAQSGSIRYSGINWNARLDNSVNDSSIPEGVQCIISGVDGNVMIVKPL